MPDHTHCASSASLLANSMDIVHLFSHHMQEPAASFRSISVDVLGLFTRCPIVLPWYRQTIYMNSQADNLHVPHIQAPSVMVVASSARWVMRDGTPGHERSSRLHTRSFLAGVRHISSSRFIDRYGDKSSFSIQT
jgi:hypothetical protein